MKKIFTFACFLPLAGCLGNVPMAQMAANPNVPPQSQYPQGVYEIKVFERNGYQISRNARLPAREYELDATVAAACKIHAGKGVTVRVYSPDGQEFTPISPRQCQ